MQELLDPLVSGAGLLPLLAIVVVAIAVLGKSADVLIDQAVMLSARSGLPTIVIGATIVSLGTTMPEATVSVLAAFNDEPGLALGNAVGSVICDTGLILGLACLIMPLPLDRKLVNRQGWVQFGAGFLLVAACLPWHNLTAVFSEGSGAHLPQWVGWCFLVLLAVYMWWSVRLARLATPLEGVEHNTFNNVTESIPRLVITLLIGTAFLVLSSAVLVSATIELAEEHFHVPTSVIAATLVAFGTSLPELVTALTAVRKNQPELAVGNVIGADILNVLFVSGAAAAVTPAGLAADPVMFQLQFPAMLLILMVFRVGIATARTGKLTRPFGAVLLIAYFLYLGITISQMPS
jgi:cation:H+ antiporter